MSGDSSPSRSFAEARARQALNVRNGVCSVSMTSAAGVHGFAGFGSTEVPASLQRQRRLPASITASGVISTR